MATTTVSTIAGALERAREDQPLVQCITNIVVAGWTANVLLAAHMAPAMVDNPREAGDFARVAGGLLVNTGTPYEETTAAMTVAARAAGAAGTPWVLDPVAAGGLAWRTGLAKELLGMRPSILRGNASEILAMTGGSGGRGVDAVDNPEGALAAARTLAAERGLVVAVSGPVDIITDGDRVLRLANGSPLLTRVTGVGCALGALMAGFAAVVADPLVAAAAATALITVAADRAAASDPGPGTFAVRLLDELSAVRADDLERDLRLS